MACVARICQAVRAGKECDAVVVKQLKNLIDAVPPEEADFWQLTQWADAWMANAILQSLKSSDEQQSLLAAYERAWRHVGSPVKLKSVIEQLEFYEDIFSSGAPATQAKRDSIRALAAKLRNALETEFLGKSSNDLAAEDRTIKPGGFTPNLDLIAASSE
jgi:hypothetical protein